MNSYFAIVNKEDEPLFEAEFFRSDYLTKLENDKNMHQFIAHAALDLVDAIMWTNNSNYLKVVDRYGEWMVSAYLTASGERFLLLHDIRAEEQIKQFFVEVGDLFAKYTLNPFYERNNLIQSGIFEVKVRVLAKKYLDK